MGSVNPQVDRPAVNLLSCQEYADCEPEGASRILIGLVTHFPVTDASGT